MLEETRRGICRPRLEALGGAGMAPESRPVTLADMVTRRRRPPVHPRLGGRVRFVGQ